MSVLYSYGPHYKLYYFPVRGRAEFIRYILAEAQIPYDEQRVSFEEWKGLKQHMPMQQLPVMEIDGKTMCQSNAIARYLAHTYGLGGKDHWEQAWADMLVDGINDLYPLLRPVVIALLSQDDAKSKEAWEKFKKEALLPFLDRYEKLLKESHHSWFCGKEITWADLTVAEFLERMHSCFDSTVLKDHPTLREHMQRVHDLPNVKRYVDQRPKMDF